MPPKFKDITFNFFPVRITSSTDKEELRRRSINLYKAWYRQIPAIVYDYKLNLSTEDVRSKLREIYVKNSRIEDPKQIAQLITKGEMELNESVNRQKEDCHLFKHFRTTESRPRSFLTKFLEGQ